MRPLVRSLLAPLLACLLLLGCEQTIDRAAARQHELIEHQHQRDGQLVDRIFAHVHELIDHQHEHQHELLDRMLATQTELLEAALELGPSTCSFSSEPSGAEVFERDLFDEWRFVGRTPLVVERPLLRSRAIEVRAAGYVSGTGYLLSDEVRGPCEEHFELAPAR